MPDRVETFVIDRPAPTADSQRIISLDVLRGFAVLGILTMNIGSFAMPSPAYFDPTAYGDLTGLNGWVYGLIHVFADLKFMAIFSMLFGAGIVLMSERMESRGLSPTGLHYRRMAWLIVFGLLHAHLLWPGDILFWYGMCGLVVYLFRRLRPRWLIVWGLVSLGLASGFMLFAGLSAEFWPPETFREVVADFKPGPEAIAAEVEAYQGGWLDQMSQRVPTALEMETTVFLTWAIWRVSGLMLLGMALFKLGVFSARRSRRAYATAIVIGVVVGIPVILYGMQWNFSTGWEAPYFFFFGLQFNFWASLL